jgi:hypothetical protein
MTPIISTPHNQLNSLHALQQTVGSRPNRSNGIHAGQPPTGDNTAIAMSGALALGRDDFGAQLDVLADHVVAAEDLTEYPGCTQRREAFIGS